MKKTINIILVILAVGFGIYCWFMLPNEVAVQINMQGEVSSTMPKLAAILIPILFAVIGFSITKKDEDTTRGILLSLAGILVQIVTFIFNR